MKSLGNIINWVGTSTSLDEKMQTLKRKCETLCCREDDIVTQLERAESFSTKKRRREVENWLGNVERTRNRVQSIELQVRGRGSLEGRFGSKQLADGVEDLTKEVAELMEQGRFSQGLTLDALDEVALLTPKLVGKAFERNAKIIWEHLRNDDVLIIGVWGMGGVGKTTLVKHIHNQIQQQYDTFGHVYWVTVSQNPSIRKLQDDIAKAIHFDISFEDDESKRAARLSRELMRRARSALILDDVWNDICLESVGIATAVNGCKLLITTRSLDVCRRLCCQEKIKIESLLEDEAWYLFEKTLEHPKMPLSPQVLEVAKCVAQECAGLPLGIITLASSMREVNDVHEWRNVLRALKESEDVLMEEKVFKVLELSYNRLNDPIVQQCFLYCALFPEDQHIEKEMLIQCLIDERLIGKMKDRQAQFDTGHTLLNKLVNSCLLEAHVGLEFVKMHDLVRDMAIKITGPRFMVKAGMQLEETPEEQEWLKDVERVSLMDNEIKEISTSTSPRCPKLQTLFLSRNHSLKRIENSFFKHMSVLQVLNLSSCAKIKELPDSVSSLKNLSALVLSFCSKLQHMPSLAELTSLKRLDLFRSGISEVPQGLEMLVNLIYLDLSDTENIKVFPSGLLPNLSKLEYLKFGVNGEVKVKGEELRGLERLSTFKGRLIFDNKNGFKEYVMSRKHYVGTNCSYEFYLGDGDKYLLETYSSDYKLNHVTLANLSIGNIAEEDVNVETLEALVKKVQSLVIANYKDARSLRDVWWLNNVTHNLKRCIIYRCEGLERVGLFSSGSILFQTLEILSLKNLHILFDVEGEGEGGGPVLLPSLSVFSCLKCLTIIDCHKIKKLFKPGTLAYLPNLEEIFVFHCHGLEEIIATTGEEEEANISIKKRSSNHSCYNLPKLKDLYLGSLPKLESICEGTMSCDALEEIKVQNCPLLQRIPLSQPPSSLQSIKVIGENGEDWWESVELDDPDAKNLFQPYLKFSCYPWSDYVG